MKQTVCYDDKPWLSHYEPGVPEKIDYEAICLPDILERSAERFPDRMALLFEGYGVAYRELKQMVDRFAAVLNGFGVRKGDRVAILLPNLFPCVIGYFSILKLGGIVVMNNPLYSDRELTYQLNDSGAKTILTLDLLANRVIDLRPKTGIDRIVFTTIGDYLPFPKKFLFRLFGRLKRLSATVKAADNLYRWKDLMAGTTDASPDVALSFDDIAMYQYTGGTTGISKGVTLTHGNLSKQVQQIAAWFPLFEPGTQVMLGALPFFHVFGLSTAMNFSVYMGWGNILVPKPQTEVLLETIRKYRPTFVPLVPAMFIGMLNHPDIKKMDLSCIRGCFSGSAPLPVEVIRDFEGKTGSVIVEGYGLTEASPVTHVNPCSGGKRKVGSIGLPVSDTCCRIVDLEDGSTDVSVGESGELLIKGPQVMAEYLNRPEETDRVLKDGWLCTGDIATMDTEGYFFIIDRKKDMIISGGFNIYPRDVEEVFFEHPKVKEACCIGVPHPRRGEVVKMFVVLKENNSADAEEFIDYCKTRLAKYKWPAEIEFRTSFPKTNVGKILRKELKSEEAAKHLLSTKGSL